MHGNRTLTTIQSLWHPSMIYKALINAGRGIRRERIRPTRRDSHHCSFNRVIRHRTFVPGAIFADFSMARQAGLRVTGYCSTNATSRIACSLLEPSHTRTVSPSGEVFSRRFLGPAMRFMSQRRGKPFRFMTCKETMSWLVVIRT